MTSSASATSTSSAAAKPARAAPWHLAHAPIRGGSSAHGNRRRCDVRPTAQRLHPAAHRDVVPAARRTVSKWRSKRRSRGGAVINPSRKSVCRSRNSLQSIRLNGTARAAWSSEGAARGKKRQVRLDYTRMGPMSWATAVRGPDSDGFSPSRIAPVFRRSPDISCPPAPGARRLAVMLGQTMHALLDRVLENACDRGRRPGRGVSNAGDGGPPPSVFLMVWTAPAIGAAVRSSFFAKFRGDRVNPGRELLGLIETVQMAEHPG